MLIPLKPSSTVDLAQCAENEARVPRRSFGDADSTRPNAPCLDVGQAFARAFCKERNRPIVAALAGSVDMCGARYDVVIGVVTDVTEICADQAAILLSPVGRGFQFQGGSS